MPGGGGDLGETRPPPPPKGTLKAKGVVRDSEQAASGEAEAGDGGAVLQEVVGLSGVRPLRGSYRRFSKHLRLVRVHSARCHKAIVSL